MSDPTQKAHRKSRALSESGRIISKQSSDINALRMALEEFKASAAKEHKRNKELAHRITELEAERDKLLAKLAKHEKKPTKKKAAKKKKPKA